ARATRSRSAGTNRGRRTRAPARSASNRRTRCANTSRRNALARARRSPDGGSRRRITRATCPPQPPTGRRPGAGAVLSGGRSAAAGGGRPVTVRTLFDGEVHVHYGQVYVESGPETGNPRLDAAFAGQVNGLCGAAARGALFLATGLHTGRVGFAV